MGGPVFRHTGDFLGTKEVVGVISSDFSTTEAFDDPNVDGESRVSMIWSAAPLAVNDAARGALTFQEMCRQGLVQDAGTAMSRVQLDFAHDGTWSQSLHTRRDNTDG